MDSEIVKYYQQGKITFEDENDLTAQENVSTNLNQNISLTTITEIEDCYSGIKPYVGLSKIGKLGSGYSLQQDCKFICSKDTNEKYNIGSTTNGGSLRIQLAPQIPGKSSNSIYIEKGTSFSISFNFLYDIDDNFKGVIEILNVLETGTTDSKIQEIINKYSDVLENGVFWIAMQDNALYLFIDLKFYKSVLENYLDETFEDKAHLSSIFVFKLIDDCSTNFKKGINHNIKIEKTLIENGGFFTITVDNDIKLKLKNLFSCVGFFNSDKISFLTNSVLERHIFPQPTNPNNSMYQSSQCLNAWLEDNKVIGTAEYIGYYAYSTHPLYLSNLVNNGTDSDPIFEYGSYRFRHDYHNYKDHITGMNELNEFINTNKPLYESSSYIDNIEYNHIFYVTLQHYNFYKDFLNQISIQVKENTEDFEEIMLNPITIQVKEDISKDLLNPIDITIPKALTPVDPFEITVEAANPFKPIEEIEEYINKTYLGTQQAAEDFQLLYKVTEYSYWPVDFSIDNNYHIHIKKSEVYLGATLYACTNKQFLYGKYVI